MHVSIICAVCGCIYNLRCVCMYLSFALCVDVSIICAVCVCLYLLRCVCMSLSFALCVYVTRGSAAPRVCSVCVCLYNLRCVCMSLALPDWFDPRGILSVASVCPRTGSSPEGYFSASVSPLPTTGSTPVCHHSETWP